MASDKARLIASLDPQHRARVLAIALWRWLPLSAIQALGLFLALPAFLAGCRLWGMPLANLPAAGLSCLAMSLPIFATCALADSADEGFASIFLPHPARSKAARLLSAPICLAIALPAMALLHPGWPFGRAPAPGALGSAIQTAHAFQLALAAAALSAPLAYLLGLAANGPGRLRAGRAGRAGLRAPPGFPRGRPGLRKLLRGIPSLADAAIPDERERMAIERASLSRSARRPAGPKSARPRL